MMGTSCSFGQPLASLGFFEHFMCRQHGYKIRRTRQGEIELRQKSSAATGKRSRCQRARKEDT
jgi:hypothetical protein